MKINAKILGIKEPIEVKQSNRNFMKVLAIQKEMLKVEAIDDDATDRDILQASIEANQAIIDFITDVLRLTSKQTDKLLDLSTAETGELLQQIILKLQNQDPEELKAAQAAEAKEDLSEEAKK